VYTPYKEAACVMFNVFSFSPFESGQALFIGVIEIKPLDSRFSIFSEHR
jgi:hypothetical protein